VSSLIGACLALACILFAVSLPLGGLPVAKSIRRWALACFAAAIVPSVACNLAASAAGQAGGSSSPGGILTGIGLLAILAVIAYVILAVRGRVAGGRGHAPDAWRERRGYQVDAGARRGWWNDDEE